MAIARGELALKRRAGSITVEGWATRAVVFAAGLNVVVLLVQLRGLIHALYRNPDNATPEVLAALSGAIHTPVRVVTLGNYHYYESWWIETATRGLPGRWQIWEGMPFLLALIGVALLAWAAWRALGTFAAIITTTLMLAIGDAMRLILFTSVTHGYSVAHGALLVAAAVLVARWAVDRRLSARRLAAVGIALAALSAVGATDQLFEFVFLPSLALAGCVAWAQRRGHAERAIAIFCVAVCAVAILGAELLDSLMRSDHVLGSFFPIALVAPTAILSNLQVTVTSLATLAGGGFFGLALRGTQILILAVGLAALIAVGVVLRFIWRYAARAQGRRSAMALPSEIFLTFWASVVVLSLVAFVLTDLPVNEASARYLPGVYVGVAALLPALVLQRAAQRTLLAGLTAVFATLVATNHLIEGTPTSETVSPPSHVAYEILNFTRKYDADHGYAAYSVAPVIDWDTRAALHAYPVYICAPNLCALPFSQISTWYNPQPGTRSFLVTDTATTQPGPVTGPPAAFGKEIASDKFGPVTVWVYDHDVAANLG